MKTKLLITLLLVYTCSLQAQNLISNPGFESGNAWWNFQTTSGVATINYTSPEAHSGTNGAHANVTTVATNNWHIQLNVPNNWTAQPNTKYKLSFYAKADHAVSFHLAVQNGAPSYSYITGSDISLSTSWQLKEFTYTSSSTLTSGQGALVFNLYLGANVANYYFDDFVLEVIPDVNLPAPTPPTIGAYYSDVYRNMFVEMGKSPSQVQAKVDAAFNQLFHGDASTEAVYYEVAPDMAYIKDVNNDDIRSEGMSYGMMIAVQLDKKDEFDRLWKFAKTYMQHQSGPREGYFSWRVNTTDYDMIDDNSASDGEEYFAMSLFFAAHRWGNGTDIYDYETEAQTLLDLMLNLETRNNGVVNTLTNIFNKDRKQVVFVPEGDNATFTDPSYHLPGFYRLWALWADQDNQFWSDAADTSEKFLLRAMHPVTGLPTEYATFEGAPKTTGFNSNSHIFAYDSWRVIGNIAMDAHWFGNEGWQSEQVNKLLAFFNSQGAGYKALYNPDGTIPANSHTAGGLVSMNGAGTLASSDLLAWTFLGALYDQTIPTGQYRYYDGMLYMLSMLHASGNFRIYKPQAASIKKDNAISELITVYPNPVVQEKENLFIDAKGFQEGMAVLKDVSGKTVCETVISNGKGTLVIPQLSKGMYYLQLSNSENSGVKKIILE